MFISKSKYEELLKEKEDLKSDLSLIASENNILSTGYENAIKQNAKLVDENKSLIGDVDKLERNIFDLKSKLNLAKIEKVIVVPKAKDSDNSFKFKTQAVKNHLLNKGNITSWEAIQKYNATRLSAIIFNLKRKGMDITSTPEESGKSRFVRYHLNKTVK